MTTPLLPTSDTSLLRPLLLYPYPYQLLLEGHLLRTPPSFSMPALAYPSDEQISILMMTGPPTSLSTTMTGGILTLLINTFSRLSLMPLAFLPLSLPSAHNGGHVLLTTRRLPTHFDLLRRQFPTPLPLCSKTLGTTRGVGPLPIKAGMPSSLRDYLLNPAGDGLPAYPEESPQLDPVPGTLSGRVPSPSLPFPPLFPPPVT